MKKSKLHSPALSWLKFFCALLLLGVSAASPAQISYATAGSNYTQNFDNLYGTVPGNNTTVAATTLPTGWVFVEAGTNANTTLRNDNGSSGTGDTYLNGATSSNERSLGSFASGSLTSQWGASFTNNTGVTLTQFTLSYTGEQWKDGGSATAILNTQSFAYSIGASSLTSGTYTNVTQLDFTALVNNTSGDVTLDGNLPANQRAISHTVTGITWAPGATIFIRWTDVNDPGNDDNLAIDNVTFTASSGAAASLSVTPSSLPFGSLAVGGTSASQSFSLSGSNLTGAPGNITVTAPSTNYQVSNNNSTWGASTTIAYASATLSSTNVFVRFTPQASGAQNGNVTLSGGGAASPPSVAVTGTGQAVPTKLVITSISPSSPVINTGFSVTVQAQDASNTPQNVVANTAVTLSVFTGTGALGGTVSGTITAGTNSVVITGVTYNTAETGVVLRATRTSGDNLTAGNSSAFTVLGVATQLAFVGVPSTGTTNTALTTFTVECRRANNSVDVNYTGNVTIARASGPGTLGGATTVAAVAGVATFSTASFNQAGTYTLSASSGSLTGATSGNIVITSPPAVVSNVLPKYMQGNSSTNSTRVPYGYIVSITNLAPNATYRYFNQVVVSSDAASTSGAGNCIFTAASGFTRTSSPALNTAGAFGTFTADASGNYTGWFVTEPTGNARFVPGTYVFMRIMLNDGASGTSIASRVTSIDSVQVINFGSSASAGSAIYGLSSAAAKNFVFLYDNISGTGRPVAGTYVESDGTANTTGNSFAPFYATNVDGVAGAYGAILPNTNTNGIRRIEQRDLSTSIVGCPALDNDGVWLSGVNTVNPSNGTTPLVITSSDAPLDPNATASVAATGISASQTTICGGSTVTLTVTGGSLGTGASWHWYTGSCGGTAIGTGVSINVSPSSATTYFVRAEGSCNVTACASLQVLVDAVTVGGTVSADQSICPNTAPADLTLGGNTGDVVKWQSSSDAGFSSPVNIANTSTTLTGAAIGPLSFTTYFRAVVQNGVCAEANSTTVTITVEDIENPAITAPADVIANADGDCSAAPSLGTPVTSDNCSVASVTNDAPAIFLLGTTTVTWTVTDANGNSATAVQQVTVNDVTDPTIVAPADITENADGNCSAAPSLGTPVTADNCSVASITNDAPTTFPLGTTNVTWTVTDGSGNSATAIQQVTVNDVTNPTITAPADITVSANSGCDAIGVSLGTPVTADNCSVASITNDAPATFAAGTTSVTWTVTDGSGNSATAVQQVTVTDLTDPTIIAPADITENADGNCSAAPALGSPVTDDNCSVASVTNDAPASFPLGTTNVTWTVTDGNGNSATAVQQVTVIDVTNPTIIAPADITVNANSGCDATSVSLGTPVTADNCSVASITNDAPTTFSAGTTNVTWTVTDGSGNSATAVQQVTVNDLTDPTIIAPADIAVNANSGCSATGVSLGTPVTDDNCSVASITNDAPAIFPAGTTNVTWTVTDANGNTATAVQQVTVNDLTDPTITAPANVTANAGANCNAAPALGTPVTADNCSVASVTNNAPASFPLGTTNVTWTVTDANGNTATAVQQVTVIDVTNPTITAPANVTVTATSNCSLTSVTLGSPVTADNCGSVSVTNNAPSGFPVGNTNVTWTATDAAGNTSTAVQVVIVNAAPALATPGSISGATQNVCTGGTYSISVGSPGASFYIWTVPPGLTITSGQGTMSIVVTTGTGFSTGTISVVASDGCSTSASSTLTVSAAPLTPSPISGPSTNICTTTATYSVPAVAGATSYTWAVPAGITITSGQGTTVLHVSFGSTYASGQITVKANNACASSPVHSITIIRIPPVPAIISGPSTDICTSTATYSIAPVNGASSYTWAAPTGVTITSGQGTTSITVSFAANFALGGLTVRSNSSCLSSATRTLTLIRIPNTPASISGPSANVCASSATYSTAAITGASSYTWTVPAGMTIVSGQGTTSIQVSIAGTFTSGNVTVKANTACLSSGVRSLAISKTTAQPGTISGPATNVCASTATYSVANVSGAVSYNWTVPATMTIVSGQGTNSIQVSIASNFSSGSVSVTATNGCTTSPVRTLAVSRTTGTPASISGPYNNVCVSSATYSVANAAGAVSYTWTVPATMTIVSGQGTNSIQVNIASNFSSGNVSVTATNGCTTSAVRTLAVSRTTATPASISGRTHDICPGDTIVYTTPLVSGMTYTWTVPALMNIISGNGTNMIRTVVTGAFVSGNVVVRASNGCTTSANRTLAIVAAPNTPGTITGQTAGVCGLSGLVYSIAPVSGATSYTWTVPAGATITSGQGTTSITVSFGATVTSGSVKVTAQNTCTSSAVRSLALSNCSSTRIAAADSAAASTLSIGEAYPNPGNGNFFLDVTSPVDGQVTVSVYDMLGQSVLAETHTLAAGTNTLNMVLPAGAKGAYMIRITDNSENVVSRVLIVQ